MTKQEIQALIDAKIAGQGSAIDVGGALPTILHEILEMAAGGENVQSNWDETDNQSPQYIQNKPSIPAPYSLPIASDETLGGVKVGDNLSIDPETGVLSAQGGGASSILVQGSIDTSTGDFNCESGQTEEEIKQALNNGTVVIFSCLVDADVTIVAPAVLAGESEKDIYVLTNTPATYTMVGTWTVQE